MTDVKQTDAGELTGGMTFITQKASDSRIETESTASVDLGYDWQLEKGRWWLYVEGNTTPAPDGVATRISESNADAGTALDGDRQGRLQISELNYQYYLDTYESLTIGLLDATSYIDTSRISNDENTQFIGVSFVNNPTIDFPDYALGLVYERDLDKNGLLARLVITSSNGLADNPNASYGQLINVDEPDKGVFVALRIGRETEKRLWSTGVWLHTAPHETLDGAQHNAKNYGAYLVMDWHNGRHKFNTRLGIANARVSSAQAFAAVSYQYRADPWVFGAGLAGIFLSQHAVQAGQDDIVQSELYLRYEVRPRLFLTGSMQFIANSGFAASDSQYDSDLLIVGGRVSYLFE